MISYKIIDDYAQRELVVVSFTGKDDLQFSFAGIRKRASRKYKSKEKTHFYHINRFLHNQSIEDQRKIYEIFEAFYNFYQRNLGDFGKEIDQEIFQYLTDFLNVVTMDKIANYVSLNAHLFCYPSNIEDKFVHDPNMARTRDKTYTSTDYQGLISTLIFVRMISPLVGEYITQIASNTRIGSANIVEKATSSQAGQRLFILLEQTDFSQSKQYEKLFSYIEAISSSRPEKKSLEIHLVRNRKISTEDFYNAVISEILFFRFINIDLDDPNVNLVSVVFQTITNVSSHSFNTSDAFKDFESPPKGVDDDNKPSRFEMLRKTSSTTMGHIVSVQHALKDIHQVLRAVGHDHLFDQEDYEKTYAFTKDLVKHPVHAIQTTLLGWFLAPYIDPRSFLYIDAERVVELLTAAHVCLKKTEHTFIALLLVSRPNPAEGNVFGINANVKENLTKEVLQEFMSHYTFFNDNDDVGIRHMSEAITNFCKAILSENWVSQAPLDVVKKYNKSNIAGSRVMVLPTELADEIAKYAQFTIKQSTEACING